MKAPAGNESVVGEPVPERMEAALRPQRAAQLGDDDQLQS